MFNVAVFARVFKKYLEDNDMCQKCGGSLKCCHNEQDKKE